MTTLYDKSINKSREGEIMTIKLEPFQSYIGKCEYTNSHGSVYSIQTDEGIAHIFTYHNGNPGDVVLLSLKKSTSKQNDNRLPLGIIESVIHFAEISKKSA